MLFMVLLLHFVKILWLLQLDNALLPYRGVVCDIAILGYLIQFVSLNQIVLQRFHPAQLPNFQHQKTSVK